MKEKYTLDNLTQNLVIVKKQTYIDYQGKEWAIGEPWRRTYENSDSGKQQIIAELPQAQVTAILSISGDTPTVEDGA